MWGPLVYHLITPTTCIINRPIITTGLRVLYNILVHVPYVLAVDIQSNMTLRVDTWGNKYKHTIVHNIVIHENKEPYP